MRQPSNRALLSAAVERVGGAAAAAVVLDCSLGYVYMLMGGTRRPGFRIAMAIEDRMGVPMRGWARKRTA